VSVNELESIFDDVKDILRDLEDDHEIDVDAIIGKYRKYSTKSWKESDDSELKKSINIDLKDNKYNFFRFNDHILPTIKKLRSFLSEYDLNIDIELVSENEFYSLDEFIEEYGSEEFHELGIIIY
jgi:predicted ribosome-associated RNA-binding protein Tma20